MPDRRHTQFCGLTWSHRSIPFLVRETVSPAWSDVSSSSGADSGTGILPVVRLTARTRGFHGGSTAGQMLSLPARYPDLGAGVSRARVRRRERNESPPGLEPEA